MPYSIKILRGLEELDPKVRNVILDLLEEIERNTRETVKRSDFDELRVAFVELTKTVNALAEAQRKSEERLTRLEKVVKELAEAQKRTEETLNKLIKRVDFIEERLEGISNSVGYSLENNTYKSLPALLKKEGIEVEGKLIRRYYEDNQINIWGEGRKNKKTLLILGEVKVRPSKKEIDKFLRIVELVTKKEKKDAFILFVAHDYHPNIEKYLMEKDIKYYWSYELD
ncbi:MAG TPA: hypothetical protein PK800_06420 [Syntrophorhabdaceae bacterium]|nr:hypothetical protein [Syntrophorhabdaceae bacterium]